MSALPTGRSILVADDSPSAREAAEKTLVAQGFLVTSVNSGLEAVRAVKRGRFDLVTLDVEMPHMDGIEALRILRVQAPDLPVIMVSGVSTLGNALQAIRQGAYDYILKPFEPEDLVLSVQRALQQRALVEENRKLIADLRSFSEHLEELVKERTAALERSEKKLLEYAHELEKSHAALVSSHQELGEAYRKLAELDGLKAKFIAITSHELRTPLTTIWGYAQLVAAQPLPPHRQGAALAAIERNVERLVGLVEEITDIAQLKEKRLWLRRESLSLTDVVEEALRELRPLAEGRYQALETRAAADLPALLADRARLGQVLQQLVLNAIRSTPDGGRITVQLENDADGGRPHVHVTVSDTGIGIEADKIPRVFDEFYEVGPWQHHHSGTHQFRSGGLGLGLAFVKGMVEEHGGRVWAESDKSAGGVGSAFHVLLPAADGT